jgi:GWxTD domain-containing protein
MIFGDNLKSMYYYFEAYNLQQGLQGAKYKSIAYLKDNNGQVLDQIATASRIKKKVADTGVEMGMINVGTLPSGTYSFVYGVSDTNDKKVVTAEKKVFIYNPDVAMTTQASSRADGDQALLSELGNLSGKDIDSEYESMIYLTSKEERDFYKNLTNDDGKRQIIYSTWADKMSDEGLTGMAYRTLYKQRTVQANESFKEPGKVGWKTDRGRVFILYGPPTNVERFPSTAANKPYQTWRYDNLRGQGGVEFVFADRFGFNKYELVHSTLRGELQDPFWERFVLVGPQDAIRSN